MNKLTLIYAFICVTAIALVCGQIGYYLGKQAERSEYRTEPSESIHNYYRTEPSSLDYITIPDDANLSDGLYTLNQQPFPVMTPTEYDNEFYNSLADGSHAQKLSDEWDRKHNIAGSVGGE